MEIEKMKIPSSGAPRNEKSSVFWEAQCCCSTPFDAVFRVSVALQDRLNLACGLQLADDRGLFTGLLNVVYWTLPILRLSEQQQAARRTSRAG
jgi:hypothetical protein